MEKRSFRRKLLDTILSQTTFTGSVLDVGGKKSGQRGHFRAPYEQVKSWKYLNISKESKPDILASVYKMPVEDSIFDCVLLSEVLEHLEDPKAALKECNRVLKHQGSIKVAIPFLFPVHGDPDDYQRFTKSGLTKLLEKSGFTIDTIETMGGLFAVVHDLFLFSLNKILKQRHPIVRRAILRIFRFTRPAWEILDNTRMSRFPMVTTGYFLTARKQS